MSNKKHKKRPSRPSKGSPTPGTRPPKGSSSHKPRRVFLRDWGYIWATLGVVAVTASLLIGLELLGWWENVIGAVLSVLLGGFGCMCLYDLALLLTTCITFDQGMVNAGKDEGDRLMLFHASSVVRLEVRDKEDRLLSEEVSSYKNVQLAFIMDSGRVNRRRVRRLSCKQLARVREALETERAHRA